MGEIFDKALNKKIDSFGNELLTVIQEKLEKTEDYETTKQEIITFLENKIFSCHQSSENNGFWDFSKEKSLSVFAEDGVLELRPMTEDYYNMYTKTRAKYFSTGEFYLNPKNKKYILEEFNQEKALFMAVIRKSDNKYIGYVGLKDTSKNLWEFCIELLPQYCRQGYGYSATKTFLKRVSEITRNPSQQFMALVEVDNIASQKLMLKLGGRLIDIYDVVFHNEEKAEKFEDEHLSEITEHMIKLADELMIEPRKLLSHVLDYRLFAEKM